MTWREVLDLTPRQAHLFIGSKQKETRQMFEMVGSALGMTPAKQEDGGSYDRDVAEIPNDAASAVDRLATIRRTGIADRI